MSTKRNDKLGIAVFFSVYAIQLVMLLLKLFSIIDWHWTLIWLPSILIALIFFIVIIVTEFIIPETN